MSTAERKARKRAGIKFEKRAKVGTPVSERRTFVDREWRRLEAAYKRGDVSKREYVKAGRAIDRGLAPRRPSWIVRIIRGANRGGGR